MLLSFLALLPKKFLSYLFGALVRIRFPAKIARQLNAFFVRLFAIDMSEAQENDFACIEDLFIRALKPGLRPMQGSFVSPCDGRLVYSQPVVAPNMAVQVKGMTYSLAELVYGNREGSQAFHPSWFATIYLAPYNYHRVHSPCAGKLLRIRYIRGTLWPVNDKAVAAIPFLFTVNERMVFEIEPAPGSKIYLVMVGAFNVGRISTPFWPDFVANSWASQKPWAAKLEEKIFSKPKELQLGQEIGTFMLGSTVVLVADDKVPFAEKIKNASGETVKLGWNLLES